MVFYYLFKRNRRNLKEKEKSDSIIFREIPDEILKKIIKKIKSQVVLLSAKKYDCLKKYSPEEFDTFLLEDKENEKIIFDSKFQNELKAKGYTSETQIEKFKKEYCFNIVKSVSAKISLHSLMAENFTSDLILKYEIGVVNQYGYSSDEYIKSLKEKLNSGEYNDLT